MMEWGHHSNSKSMQMECQSKDNQGNSKDHKAIDKRELISSLKKSEQELIPISRLFSEQLEKLFQSW